MSDLKESISYCSKQYAHRKVMDYKYKIECLIHNELLSIYRGDEYEQGLCDGLKIALDIVRENYDSKDNTDSN